MIWDFFFFFFVIGCEYGNEFENCRDLIYPYACYHPVNEKSCCGLCSLYKNDLEGKLVYYQGSHNDVKVAIHIGDHLSHCAILTFSYKVVLSRLIGS